MDNSLHSIKSVRLKSNLHGLGELRTAAKNNSKETAHDVAHETAHKTAQQFEALFIQTMLKSMRQASPGDPLTGSDQANMYRDMLDSQLSGSLANNGGIGLAKIIERQITGVTDHPNSKYDAKTEINSISSVNKLTMANQLWNSNSAAIISKTPTLQQDTQKNRINWNNPGEFIQKLEPAAIKAAKDLGTKPEAVLAIAALETGWGKHIAIKSDGESSFNLFGIKANLRNQPKVMAATLEYTNGQFVQKHEPFRSYQNPTDSVIDFANFIQQNPRYKQALAKADNPETFIKEIHKAGYATDPDYADKAINVMQKIKALTQETNNIADNYI